MQLDKIRKVRAEGDLSGRFGGTRALYTYAARGKSPSPAA